MEERWPRYGRCNCVFFYGDGDFIETAAAEDICARLVPRPEECFIPAIAAELKTVPDSGHSPQTDNPQFVAKAVLEHIHKLEEVKGEIDCDPFDSNVAPEACASTDDFL